MEYSIVRTVKGKKILFEVFDEKGIKVGQRLASREYVACLVYEGADGSRRIMQTWFGRIDLIGKGDSRHYLGQPDIKIARLAKT